MKNKGLKILGWGLLILTGSALADSLDSLNQSASQLFTATTYDLSLSYLRMLFGTVGNQLVGASQGLAGQIFAVFNLGMLVFAGSFVSYTTFTSVVGTASDGSKGLGGGSMTGWVPFRIVAGVSLLVPQFGGYSMIQVIVMWSVVQGVGLADHIWAKALVYIKNTGGALLTSAADSSSADLKTLINGNITTNYLTKAPTANASGSAEVADLMAAGWCTAAMQQSDTNLGKATQYIYGVFMNTVDDSGTTTTRNCGKDGYRLCFGRRDTSDPSATAETSVCGEFSWNDAGSWSAESGSFSMTPSARRLAMNTAVYGVATAAYNSAQTSYAGIYAQQLADTSGQPIDVSCDNSSSSQASACSQATDLSSLATLYFDALRPIRTLVTDETVASEAWMTQALKAGWIAAGYNYYNLVNNSNTPVPALQKISDAELTIQQQTYKSSNASIVTGAALTAYQAAMNGLNSYATAANTQINEIFSASLSGAANSSATGSSGSEALEGNVAYQNIASSLDSVASEFLTLLVYGRGSGVDGADITTVFDSATAFSQTSTMFQNRTDIVSDNILNLMIRVISKMLGINPYDVSMDSLKLDGYNYMMDDPYTTETSLNSLLPAVNPKCTSTSLCNLTSNSSGSGCFAQLYDQSVDIAYSDSGSSSALPCIQAGTGLLGGMVANMAGYQVDPLLNMTALGLTLIQEAINYWVYTVQGVYTLSKDLLWRYQVVMASTAAVGGLAVGLFQLIPVNGGAVGAAISQWLTQTAMTVYKMLFQFDITQMTIYLPFGASIALMFFTIGIIMGIYLPFIPFMVYTFSVIGWLIAVIEAMIAAPLVALGVTHPEGHDLLGKAEQSIILLLGIFVRPAALLMGFILSIILLHVAMDLFNYGFMNVLSQYISNENFTGSTITFVKIIGLVGILIVYTYVAIDVVNMAFSLIYKVPENLMRWIGGQPEQFGIGQMLQEVKSGVSQAGGQVGQAASQTASSPPQVGSPSDSKMDMKLKPDEKDKDTSANTDPNGGDPAGGGDDPAGDPGGSGNSSS